MSQIEGNTTRVKPNEKKQPLTVENKAVMRFLKYGPGAFPGDVTQLFYNFLGPKVYRPVNIAVNSYKLLPVMKPSET